MKKPFLILSCEHAGNQLPRAWKDKVVIPKDVLASHRGWDIGALDLAKIMRGAGAQKFFFCETTRLLIELNRSLHHKNLLSSYSRRLTPSDRQEIIQSLYTPYRSQVIGAIIPPYEKRRTVWHLSVHTFTPKLNGVVRNAEIGILYDPKRLKEKEFAKAWRDLLKNRLGDSFRIRMNYPYAGTADGFVTALRKRFPGDHYVGIELEVNQGLFVSQSKWKTVGIALQQTLSTLLKRGVKKWND